MSDWPRATSFQRRTSRRARSTCQGAIFSSEASSPLVPENPCTLAIPRSFIATAATSGTGSEPVDRAWRSRLSAFFASPATAASATLNPRSEEHTSELQSRGHLVCRLLLEKKKKYEGVILPKPIHAP